MMANVAVSSDDMEKEIDGISNVCGCWTRSNDSVNNAYNDNGNSGNETNARHQRHHLIIMCGARHRRISQRNNMLYGAVTNNAR